MIFFKKSNSINYIINGSRIICDQNKTLRTVLEALQIKVRGEYDKKHEVPTACKRVETQLRIKEEDRKTNSSSDRAKEEQNTPEQNQTTESIINECEQIIEKARDRLSQLRNEDYNNNACNILDSITRILSDPHIENAVGKVEGSGNINYREIIQRLLDDRKRVLDLINGEFGNRFKRLEKSLDETIEAHNKAIAVMRKLKRTVEKYEKRSSRTIKTS